MLIRRARIEDRGIVDVRISGDRIAEIGELAVGPDERVIEAGGGALLPGLHDHHIHLLATAAEATSLRCDRESVASEEILAAALSRPGRNWIRGILYDENIAGMLDADRLDRMAPGRPVRIQDRTGRVWFLNHQAIGILLEGAPAPPGLERVNGRWTGRLFDGDQWLRQALAGKPPSLDEVGSRLSRSGITGVTDLTPRNDAAELAHFSSEQARGVFPQHCLVGGRPSLAGCEFAGRMELGPLKFHLHEASLPEFGQTVSLVRTARAQQRAAAFHCVTETELVFALAAIGAAATGGPSRIEHGAVIPDLLAHEIARLGCAVVTQPHFIFERGERYLKDVERKDLPWLYRLGGLADHAINLAGGSDSPWGSADPWLAMRAAVSRQTRDGSTLGESEKLTPEQALSLYLKDPHELERERRLGPGVRADLCLLDRSWSHARKRLMASDVRATIVAGSVVYERIDEPPLKSRSSANPAAGEDHEVSAMTADPTAQ